MPVAVAENEKNRFFAIYERPLAAAAISPVVTQLDGNGVDGNCIIFLTFYTDDAST